MTRVRPVLCSVLILSTALSASSASAQQAARRSRPIASREATPASAPERRAESSPPRIDSPRQGRRAAVERPRVEPPCLGPEVEVRRANGGFRWRGSLLDCRGQVRAEALAGLAAIASPNSGASNFSPDLATIAAAIVRVAPVAGWRLSEPRRANRSDGNGRPTARLSGERAACPRGQEPAPPEERAPERDRRASAGAKERARRTRAPAEQRQPRCRPISVERDAHTRDVVVELERRVRVVHPRLVELVARVVERWPGHVIEVVSGYRPSGDPHAGSRHAHARALDFRVVGVAREALRDFCRTLPLAGVGYYPHSVFVHLDVRDRSEGSARWTDYSEPGERARYGHWPPSADDVVREVRHITARVDALLEAAARNEGNTSRGASALNPRAPTQPSEPSSEGAASGE
jgi:hypothetical protein